MKLKPPTFNTTKVWTIVFLGTTTRAVHAGMTVYDLSDVYRLRFQDISFFLLLVFATAWGFKMAWSVLTKDFPKLPPLRYPQALAFTLILGAGMLLILTMISGIREVLTPGAWRRQGSGYQLNSPLMETERTRAIEILRDSLLIYSRQHEGKFPPHDYVEEIPLSIWRTPAPGGARYIYLTGRVSSNAPGTEVLLASEPGSFGEQVKVILSSGEIQNWKWADVEQVLQRLKP